VEFKRADKIDGFKAGETKNDSEMHIEELEEYISKYAVKVLKDRGVERLFPPQKLAVERGLFSNRNLVVSIPTASGKTLIAELAMLRETIQGGKCLYVVPLRALASEKYESFRDWEKVGLRIGITTGDYESTDDWLGDCDIIVTTAEKADSLMRNRSSWIDRVSCLIVDEVHLLDSVKRGPNLEILISRMKNRRIVALSATIPNAKELAEWLNAECIESSWRPVPLYEGVFYNGKLSIYEGLKLKEERKLGREYSCLVRECIENGGQVLVFDSTRRNSESTAVKLSELDFGDEAKLSRVASKILEENDGEMSNKLAKCVEKGVAFHHAGLLGSQRKVVEDAFKDGLIKVIVSTPTLAAGVNLPARRVVIKSYHRFSGYASIPIKVMEYKQMVGRAGRPGMDEKGEAIIVVKSDRARKEVFERYIAGEIEKIESKLGAENCMRFHTLALASELKSVEKLEEFFESTFFFHQNEIPVWFEIERILKKLEKWRFVETFVDKVTVTSLGELISRLYIDPMTGNIFCSELEKHEKFTEMSALHLICRAPDMEKLYVRKDDDWLEELLFSIYDELTYVPSSSSSDFDWFLEELKTAACLSDWINEVDEDEICNKYSIAPGDLRRIVETAEWLANALYRIAEFKNHNSRFFHSLTLRIKYGVKNELLELVQLRGIGRARARKLYESGIKGIKELFKNREQAEKVVGRKIVENALKSFKGMKMRSNWK
jgi:helicase